VNDNQAEEDTMRSLSSLSLRRLGGALVIAALALAAGGALADPPTTIEPGKLTIGFNGDMPMTSWKDGKLIGTDGALLAQIAANLGLEVKPQQMEWSALIQATKQGKVDIMLGSMGWTKERTKIMLLTDPIYYFGTFLLQKKDTSYATFADMKGRSVGTVTGFTLVPELKTVDGIGEVKLYDTSDGVLQDLVAGRLDMAILDPPLVQWGIVNHPEWKIKQVPLDPEPDKYPIMSTKYSVIFGVNKQEPELAAAISKIIAEDIWPNCINVKTMAKYGMGDKAWFVPPAKDPRIGVDREKDYTSRTAPGSCFQ